MNKISIIIPVYNEVETINKVLLHLEESLSKKIDYQIIIVDGGSTDGSQKIVQEKQHLKLISSKKGRSKQMNAGAKAAEGNILYFLHCDSFPPKNFDLDIVEYVEKGKLAGCFRLKFDDTHPLLLCLQWFTRFNHISCRGGDQSLFVTQKLFDDIGGFNERFRIYEDNEIIKRLYKHKQFFVIPKDITTSSRRYRDNGVFKLQYHFTIIHVKRILGHSPESMITYYNKNVNKIKEKTN